MKCGKPIVWIPSGVKLKQVSERMWFEYWDSLLFLKLKRRETCAGGSEYVENTLSFIAHHSSSSLQSEWSWKYWHWKTVLNLDVLFGHEILYLNVATWILGLESASRAWISWESLNPASAIMIHNVNVLAPSSYCSDLHDSVVVVDLVRWALQTSNNSQNCDSWVEISWLHSRPKL